MAVEAAERAQEVCDPGRMHLAAGHRHGPEAHDSAGGIKGGEAAFQTWVDTDGEAHHLSPSAARAG